MKYAEWKAQITDTSDLEQHSSSYATIHAVDFLGNVLNAYEADNPGFEELDIDTTQPLFSLYYIRNIYGNEENQPKDGDYRKTKYYQDFVAQNPIPRKIFAGIDVGDSKAVLTEIKQDNKILSRKKPITGDTPLNALMVKMKEVISSSSSKKEEEFKELATLVNQIIDRYGPHLALAQANTNGNTVLHRIFWYARTTKTPEARDTFLALGIKLLDSIKDPDVFSALSKCKNKAHPPETIQDNIFKPVPLSVAPHSAHVKTIMQPIFAAFEKRFNPQVIFDAIATADLKSVEKYLAGNAQGMNQQDEKYGSTPLMTVLVRMSKLYEESSKLSSSQLIEKLKQFEKISLEIIKYHPDLTIADKGGNTVFHRLFWYATTLSKTPEQLDIFLNIGKNLIHGLSLQQLKKISMQRNNKKSSEYPFGETFIDNLYNVKLLKTLTPQQQKNLKQVEMTVTPLLDNFKEEKVNIDFSSTSLRTAIEEEILVDSISSERLKNPYFFPHPNHGHTLSENTWERWLSQKSTNPLNQQELKKTNLIPNKAIAELLKILNDNPESTFSKFIKSLEKHVESDNNKLWEKLEGFVELCKKDPTYQNNILLIKFTNIIAAYKTHQLQVKAALSTTSAMTSTLLAAATSDTAKTSATATLVEKKEEKIIVQSPPFTTVVAAPSAPTVTQTTQPQSSKIVDKKEESVIKKPLSPDKVTGRYYDMDGCLLSKVRNKPESQSLYAWLIEHRKELLDQEIEKIKARGFSKVVLGLFTNRQSKEIDDLNILVNNSTSCIPILLILQDYYRQALGSSVEVSIDPFLLADITGNPKNGGDKQAGDSYKLMVKEKYADDKKVDDSQHAKYTADKHKITFFYAILHRLASLNSDAKECHAAFVDDRIDIFDSINSFANENPQLLPKCHIELIQYAGSAQGEQCFPLITGTGVIDKNYDWSIRYLYLQYLLLNNQLSKEQFTNTAEKLKEAHINNSYYRYDGEMQVSWTFDKESYKTFAEFREKEVPKLTSTLGEKSNYTTLQELIKEGYISQKSLTMLGFSAQKTELTSEGMPSQSGMFSQMSGIISNPSQQPEGGKKVLGLIG